MQILQPPGWPRPKGYSNGVSARGRQLFVAGQVGWEPLSLEFASDDFCDQVGQALANIRDVLAADGAEPRHVTRMTWFITSREAYFADRARLGTAYRAVMGDHYPAMTTVQVAALLPARALVEIEALAVVSE
ncbi:MAG TPA: RidA family protein [Gammaproteobacteria bacterium]